MKSSTNYDELIQDDRIHASLYTSEEIFEAEMERMFHMDWVYVGHASEVPKTGDYVLRQIGRQHVILVRDADGGVQVLLNRCSHRANMLLWRDRGNTRKSITCAYHGWTFGLKGELLDVPYNKGLTRPVEELGLGKAAAVSQYRGFVFACLLKEPAHDLATHLGAGVKLIDRTCDLSPTGEIAVGKNWLQHSVKANWKLVADNNTDGYHVGFVHGSFLNSFKSQYETTVSSREELQKGATRDWGQGHGELDFAATYQRPLDWLTGKADRYPDYLAKMKARYEPERLEKLLFEGPAHATIFPNLFLGEMNVEMLQPISANEVVVHVTPLLLVGAPEVNVRSIRQTPGAIGPAAFLFADDATLAERNHIALTNRRPDWVDLGRGLNRQTETDGVLEGHFTDETSARAFWRQYRKVMRGAQA
ncbi:MAG: Rieske 2Fe-2S domain-containing protein [Burkholderiaceae bacterium]|nr:Rieske 2Fe-2S domain-containing protein [Burkholderiaceae bacterium]